VIHFKSLKVHRHMFRAVWSGNCCFMLLLLLLNIQVLSMRMCVWVGGLCFLFFCIVPCVSFSNAYKPSRCARVFEMVDCAVSCVLCCVLCSRMHLSPPDVHMCLRWWIVHSCVRCCVFCSRMQSSRCTCVFELVDCVLSSCVLCCVTCSRMHWNTYAHR
jgi:hypothetical protein